MFIPTSRAVKSAARSALHHPSYDPKKLGLIYAGVSTGVALLITLINYLLSQQIHTSGGIAGLSTRGILSTIQMLLPILSALFIPLWEIGMLRAGIGYMRNEQIAPNTLTAGLRRFGPVLRLLLLRGVLLIAISFVTANISSILFSLTPFSASLQEFANAFLTSGEITEEMIAQILPALTPLYAIFFFVFCVIAIPFFYRLRMADFIIMDKPAGAMSAMLFSFRFMRGNAFKLFKLDFSFWWYYAISLAAAVISYLPEILQLGGISLPLSGNALFFLCYGISLLIQFILTWQSAGYMQTSYAIAFDSIAPKAPATPTGEQPQ